MTRKIIEKNTAVSKKHNKFTTKQEGKEKEFYMNLLTTEGKPDAPGGIVSVYYFTCIICHLNMVN